MPDQAQINERVRQVARLTAVAAAALALAVLIGWILNVRLLTSAIPGTVAMNPLTAILFLPASVALWLTVNENVDPTRRRVAQALAAVVAAMGAAILVAYAVDGDWGPDRWLFMSRLDGNRMAPNTAVLFLVTGVALFTLRQQWVGFWLSQGMGLFAAAAALMSLIGYGYGTQLLYGVSTYIPMAVNTAGLFETLAVGILCARPDRGVAAVLSAADMGGAMARRLLPAAIFIPCVVGLLRVIGQRAGMYDMEFGAALMVVMNVVILVGSVLITASALNRADAGRRQAMETLHNTVLEVRDLYNNAPCGYHSLDVNGQILSINDTELRWLGYERQEVEGRETFASFLSAHSRSRFTASFQQLQMAGSLADVELEMVRRDGTTFPVVINATAIRDDEGKFLSSRFSVFDATERKRAELAVRQLNQELEQRVALRTAELAAANRDLLEKNQENEMFVYSVSHDLRSPLVSLQGFSKELGLTCSELQSLLAQDPLPADIRAQAGGLIDDGMRQSTRFIQTAVLRLSNIIDALLRLSRAGRVEYRHQNVDVNSVVSRVVEATRLAQFDGDVEVRIHDLPMCCGDATAVEQVFANLIGNAIKYRDPKRACEIEVGAAPVPSTASQAHDASGSCYYVRDTGLGIPEGSREKIFLAFKRAHPNVAEGDGMGLAIVRRVVERHGGKVWVESEMGKGSTFFVLFPAARPLEAAASVTIQLQGDKNGSRTDGHLAGRR